MFLFLWTVFTDSNLSKARVIILWCVSDSVMIVKPTEWPEYLIVFKSAFSCWDTRQQRCRHKPSAVHVCVYPADVSDNELTLLLQPWLVVLCWLPIRHSTVTVFTLKAATREAQNRLSGKHASEQALTLNLQVKNLILPLSLRCSGRWKPPHFADPVCVT